MTMGLVDTVSIPTLLRMVAGGRIPAERMGTRSFTFDRVRERRREPGAQGRHHAGLRAGKPVDPAQAST